METFFTPSEESLLFLYSVILGVGLGLLYDILRGVRLVFPHNVFFVGLEDVLFLIIWALSIIAFAIELGRGQVRAYFLLGNILGFILNLLTIGNIITKVITNIVHVFKSLAKVFKKLKISSVNTCNKASK